MRRRACLLFVAICVVWPAIAIAQQLSSELAEAPIILRGQVIAVAVEPACAPDEMAATRVTLRVEDGIRGAKRGETITIRQWSAASDEYRVGESLVLFLHAPSPEMGLTSPVGGRAGHRRVDEVPQAALDSMRTAAPQVTPVQPPPRPRRRIPPARGRAVEAEP